VRGVILLAAVICAAAVLGQGPGPTSRSPVFAQVVDRVVYREATPPCAESIKELGLESQPVQCIEAPAPTHDAPRMHGAYRLFRESYVGPLTYEDRPDTAPPGVVSGDCQTIKASSM